MASLSLKIGLLERLGGMSSQYICQNWVSEYIQNIQTDCVVDIVVFKLVVIILNAKCPLKYVCSAQYIGDHIVSLLMTRLLIHLF